MTSDNADQRYQQPPGITSDNTNPRTVARDYRHLREQTRRCERLATELGAFGHDRARQVLDRLAARGRGVLAAFHAEPALHDHLDHLAYGRAVSLLAELLLQASGLAAQAAATQADEDRTERDRAPGRAPVFPPAAELWDDLDTLAERADELGALAAANAPRLHLDTEAGSRALSRTLVDVHQLGQAADTIDTAIARARALPHPDPAVDALAAAATQLREQAAALRAGDPVNWVTAYFGAQQQRRAVSKEEARA